MSSVSVPNLDTDGEIKTDKIDPSKLIHDLEMCENATETELIASANNLKNLKLDNDFKFVFSESHNFEEIRKIQAEFVKERNWSQFHTPRNLLLAMVGEVGELSELFTWKEDVKEGLPDWKEEEKQHLAQEISDVFIYLLLLSEKCHIDLPKAVLEKIALNKKKYPAEKVCGSSKKYTEYL